MRTVKVFEEAWPLHTPFVIARGSRSEARVWWLNWKKKVLKAPVNARRIRVMEKVMPR